MQKPFHPLIIDCDTGRDDALTLWLAVKSNLPLAAIVASYGNTVVDNVADNTARVLSLVNGDIIPLIVGLARPQRDHKLFEPVVEGRQQVVGNGLCNLEFPKSPRSIPSSSTPEEMAYVLKDLAREHGALDYFVIGPASNLAATAKILDTSLKDTVARVTMMGGKLDPLWTQMPGADFNIASDPYAVDDVMRLGLPMRFVPMNATWPIVMTQQEVEVLRPITELAQWAQDLMLAHCRHYAPDATFRFHDPSVIVAAQLPEYYVEKRLALICDEESKDFGRLIETPEGIPCQVYQTNKLTQEFIKQSILYTVGFDVERPVLDTKIRSVGKDKPLGL